MVVVPQTQITQLGLALTVLWSVFVMAFQRKTKHEKNTLINNETNVQEESFLATGTVN
jgi:hypothetical protein